MFALIQMGPFDLSSTEQLSRPIVSCFLILKYTEIFKAVKMKNF